jgi:type IV pilus assembly protein PilA
MLQKFRVNHDQKGFTLVELMIVVAIIGILAAIAIPQFAQYRQRAFNSSAQNDVRNAKTSQEVLQADHQVYGVTEEATLPGAGTDGGGGAELQGALPAATRIMSGALITANNGAGDPVAIGIGVGNNVFIIADTGADTTVGANGSFILTARHLQGPRSYATDSDSTAMYFVEDPELVGQTALTVVPVTPTAGIDDFLDAATGDGIAAEGLGTNATIPNWTAM